MSDRTKRQVFEMGIGIVIHNLVLSGICAVFFRESSVFFGIIAGMLTAMGLLISMAYSTELCVEAADEDYAKKKMASHAMIRAVATVVLVGIFWKATDFNPLSCVLGILGLKTGAYLYPVVHKLLNHKSGEDPDSLG